ncbi:hypothetical protein NKR23_g10627 [Pleurostoma richardsiae]|uniref:Uncharacterized protein n=1 Tax=Pleurostoma richardsiae TaxID=41990 RepID=A0AA38RE87_9PEZI|nr:hypothetical protein NKR23_g10627 [Pleurostoma richardsiae]
MERENPGKDGRSISWEEYAQREVEGSRGTSRKDTRLTNRGNSGEETLQDNRGSFAQEDAEMAKGKRPREVDEVEEGEVTSSEEQRLAKSSRMAADQAPGRSSLRPDGTVQWGGLKCKMVDLGTVRPSNMFLARKTNMPSLVPCGLGSRSTDRGIVNEVYGYVSETGSRSMAAVNVEKNVFKDATSLADWEMNDMPEGTLTTMTVLYEAPTNTGAMAQLRRLRRLRRSDGVSQRPRALESVEQAEARDKCANCGRADHELADCVGPPQNRGYFIGCPACNNQRHFPDECGVVNAMTSEEKWDLFIRCRAQKPSFPTRQGWLALAREHPDDELGYPLSMEFVAREWAAKKLWEDHNYGAPAGPQLERDPATETLAITEESVKEGCIKVAFEPSKRDMQGQILHAGTTVYMDRMLRDLEAQKRQAQNSEGQSMADAPSGSGLAMSAWARRPGAQHPGANRAGPSSTGPWMSSLDGRQQNARLRDVSSMDEIAAQLSGCLDADTEMQE